MSSTLSADAIATWSSGSSCSAHHRAQPTPTHDVVSGTPAGDSQGAAALIVGRGGGAASRSDGRVPFLLAPQLGAKLHGIID